MKLVTTLAFALAAALTVPAFAAEKAAADTLTPQQQKLSACAKDAHAKNLKGADYKSYMSTCTKGTATAPAATASTAAAGDAASSTASADTTKAADKKAAKTGEQKWVAAPSSTANPQQQKMRTCAADAKAKGLKGADRRAFMSTCLKGDSSTPTAATTPAKKSTK